MGSILKEAWHGEGIGVLKHRRHPVGDPVSSVSRRGGGEGSRADMRKSAPEKAKNFPVLRAEIEHLPFHSIPYAPKHWWIT